MIYFRFNLGMLNKARISNFELYIRIRIRNYNLRYSFPSCTYVGSEALCCGHVISRLVVFESGLGLESGLESIFAGLGLGLELKGLGLGLGLGSYFLQVLCQVHL